MWVLGFESGSSVRATISPAHVIVFNINIVDAYYRFCFALRAKHDCNDQAVLKIQGHPLFASQVLKYGCILSQGTVFVNVHSETRVIVFNVFQTSTKYYFNGLVLWLKW